MVGNEFTVQPVLYRLYCSSIGILENHEKKSIFGWFNLYLSARIFFWSLKKDNIEDKALYVKLEDAMKDSIASDNFDDKEFEERVTFWPKTPLVYGAKKDLDLAEQELKFYQEIIEQDEKKIKKFQPKITKNRKKLEEVKKNTEAIIEIQSNIKRTGFFRNSQK